MRPINKALAQGVSSSSSAEWLLPNNAQILWAGLYWSARRNTGSTTIRFAHPPVLWRLPATNIRADGQRSE